MLLSEKETAGIRRFVCEQLSEEPDLSTLTLGILKRRYLTQVRRESLSPDARSFMKQVVQEELMKMQDDDRNGSDLETKKPQNKRKREGENDKVTTERKGESKAKKFRSNLSSSSESEDKDDCKTGSEESEDEDQVKALSDDSKEGVKKSQQKRNGNTQQINSDDDDDSSTEEERNESRQKGNERKCGDSPKEAKTGETRSSNTSEKKKTPQSDEENETDADGESERSDKVNGNESSDDSEKEEKTSVEKKNNDPDSDSSSLPSLDDEHGGGTENAQDDKKKQEEEKKKKKRKKTTGRKDESTRSQKDENKAVIRLKRYISLCGAWRNYKKLLGGCRSIKSKVAVLKKELEDLGIQGDPTIEKCKKVKKNREDAQELAALDVNNIITTQGRPKRRAAAWREQRGPSSSAYQYTLNSDSDQENDAHRGRKRAIDWANLQGIISDDADSD